LVWKEAALFTAESGAAEDVEEHRSVVMCSSPADRVRPAMLGEDRAAALTVKHREPQRRDGK